MSHLHERAEKICLNCGTGLTGRYCPNCGQENLEPKESFWHLLGHFLADLTHFDGKFFVTIKYLLFRPGFLTSEYIKGKRASYLNPIRMYLFISALFFLLLMSFFLNNDRGYFDKPQKYVTKTHLNVNPAAANGLHITRSFLDSIDKEETNKKFIPKTLAQYDSVQNTLPVDKRDGNFTRTFLKKLFTIQSASENERTEMLHKLAEKLGHSAPYMLFISVPLIALLLQLLYIRRRKQFFYVSHIIFLLHYYCFIFISLILVYTCGAIGGWAHTIATLIKICFFAYLYIAMLNFYKQGWFKTLVKYGLLFMISTFILITILATFFLADVWTLA